MAHRIYLGPIIGTGAGRLDARRPKYFEDIVGRIPTYMDYGLEPTALVRCNVTDAQHNLLIANADIAAWPADLTMTPNASQVLVIQAQLAALNIPEDWVGTLLPIGAIIKRTAMIFQFGQCFHGFSGGGRIFGSGRTLDTRFSALPANGKANLKGAADAFRWDTSVLSSSSSLRDIVKTLAHQWAGEIYMEGQAL